MSEPEFLTVAEVARRMRVAPMTIYRWCETEKLPHVRIGSTYRIPAAAWDEYLKTHTFLGG